MHPQVIQDHPGNCPICHMALTPMGSGGAAATAPAERTVLYWWDPALGSSSIADRPGTSARGAQLVPVYAEAAGPAVQIDPAVVQNMGVRTAKVTQGALHKTVRTLGLLNLPEPGLHDVSLRVNGWIEKLHANQEGMRVQKGDVLFEVYSPELQVAGQELIAATRARRSVPETAADAVKRQSESLVASATRKLKLWEVDDRDIEAIARVAEPPRTIPFRSPVTGDLDEKMVVEGSAVQPGMKLLRIADHSKMWLDLQVYAEDLPFVKVGQSVKATIEGIPGRPFTGTVTFAHPRIDPTSRTLKLRATLENPDDQLKPGMYAAAEIESSPVADAIQCPREAVIDTGTRQIAFVTDRPGHFTPRRVTVGLRGDGDQVQIVSGLAPGETVVTSGQFLMDVESRTIEATEKLSGSAADDDSGDHTPQVTAPHDTGVPR